ncbi:MAG: DNA repair protein RadC [Peptococcaceae bacterium]|nr:DNA repair protein RadC [Peptococcaceae bacterium]
MRYRMLELPENLRPQERLYRYGTEPLTDAELLAILLRTGSQQENVLELAERILLEVGGLSRLAQESAHDLTQHCGIGPAKAAQILAALELGRRMRQSIPEKRSKITCPEDAANLVMEQMCGLDREHFWVIMLNTKNSCLGIDKVSIGSLNSTVIHPRECFKEAIRRSANAVILVHNHPSGDTLPSPEDRQITARLVQGGKLLGIEVVDHIIIGDRNFFSCKEGFMI